jgi:hypothetical protein
VNRVGVDFAKASFSAPDNADVKDAMLYGNNRINFKLKDRVKSVSNASLALFKLEKNHSVLDS